MTGGLAAMVGLMRSDVPILDACGLMRMMGRPITADHSPSRLLRGFSDRAVTCDAATYMTSAAP